MVDCLLANLTLFVGWLRFVLSLTYLVWFRPFIAHNVVLIACVASMTPMRMYKVDFVPTSKVFHAFGTFIVRLINQVAHCLACWALNL